MKFYGVYIRDETVNEINGKLKIFTRFRRTVFIVVFFFFFKSYKNEIYIVIDPSVLYPNTRLTLKLIVCERKKHIWVRFPPIPVVNHKLNGMRLSRFCFNYVLLLHYLRSFVLFGSLRSRTLLKKKYKKNFLLLLKFICSIIYKENAFFSYFFFKWSP